MLGWRAGKETDLGHYPSTYCKATEGIAGVLTLLHEAWLTSQAFTKSVGCAVLAIAVMWDIDMGLKRKEV